MCVKIDSRSVPIGLPVVRKIVPNAVEIDRISQRTHAEIGWITVRRHETTGTIIMMTITMTGTMTGVGESLQVLPQPLL